MNEPTIIFTMRDPAACRQLIPVIREAALLHPVRVFAQGVSPDLLKKADIRHSVFSGGRAGTEEQYNFSLADDDHEAQGWIENARSMLSETPKAILVTGNSSLGFGVDEIFRCAAKRHRADIPVVTLFDFWSAGNALDGAFPDVGLVLDQYAANLIGAKLGISCVIIGSPRHETEHLPDPAKARGSWRTKLDCDGLLALFIAQTHDVPGHDQNFDHLATAMAGLNDDSSLLVVKSHPKFPQVGDDLARQAKAIGVRAVHNSNTTDLLYLLAAADAVFICTSMVEMDYAHYVASSPRPLGIMAHLFIGNAMREHMVQICGSLETPLVQSGIGWNINTEAELQQLLEDVRTSRERAARYHRACVGINPKGSTHRAYGEIVRQLQLVAG